MAEKQKLICPECTEEFEFDPNSDEKVITSLNESFRPQPKSDVEVVAYLECPQGHLKPYKVKKDYK
ncbi:hypothetical protein [Fluviicola sp.]|uniref:hypothetical protein n=1 Tax=Fluviicola sp. TaxID=1917219 RepID=UPI003D27FF65